MTRVVSVFCGCGGLDYGFKQAGFELTYACDVDQAAVDCYAKNVDENVFRRDAQSAEFHRDIADLGTCDVVLGGFPCQGFSKAGPKRVADDRNSLYSEMLRVVGQLKPRIFIAENVDGLSQNFQGTYLKRIVSDFKRVGYEVEHRVLDAVSFGVPQHRRRIIFVGTQVGAPQFEWPEPIHTYIRRNGEFNIDSTMPLFDFAAKNPRAELKAPLSIQDAIEDLLELKLDIADHVITDSWPDQYAKIFDRIKEGQKLCNVRHAQTSVYTWDIPEVFGEVTEREKCLLETISKNRRHKRFGDVPNGNPLAIDVIQKLSGIENASPEISNLLASGYLKEINGKFDLKGAMFCSGIFKRPIWNQPAPTVLTNFHNPRYFLHPLRNRPFTLRECARLQSFPDSFTFTSEKVSVIDGYRLVGNAVPPELSRVLAKAVAKFVDVSRGSMVAS